MNYHVAVGVLSFLSCYLLLPVAIRYASSHGLLDHPDGVRRVHSVPVPRIGGVVILIAAGLCTIAVGFWRNVVDLAPLVESTSKGMLAGGALIFGLGVLDDIKGVVPVLKLTVQVIAASLVVASGFTIDQIGLSTSTSMLSLGWFAVPITVIWIVGMTNAFNLIDGADGLAGTFALMAFSGALVVDLLLHGTSNSLMAAAFIGAVFAFLRYNNSPARVFLGDSGSTTLGFFLSIHVAVATTDGHGTYFLAMLAILAYPITDTAIAIARRWLRGHALSRADGRHVHHQILGLGLSPNRTIDTLGLFFMFVAAVGILISLGPAEATVSLVAGGGILAILVFVYTIRWLGYAEFAEFGASVASVLVNARRHVGMRIRASEVALRIEGADSLGEVDSILGECADELHLLQAELVRQEPSLPRPEALQIAPADDRPWRLDYPISWELNGVEHEALLRLWCARPRGYRRIGAERIANYLAPAVERWVRSHPGAIPVAEREPRPDGVVKAARSSREILITPDRR